MRKAGKLWHSAVKRFRAHFRSNVVGYIALFAVIVGGTAQALPGRRVVDHNDLQRHVVHRGNIHDGAVNSAKAADDSLTGTDIDEPSLVGVPVAGLKLAERCRVVVAFNNVGREPTAEEIGTGHCRITVPGLVEAISAGRVILQGSVAGAEPGYTTHVLNSDGTIDIFVWDQGGEPARSGVVDAADYVMWRKSCC